MIGDLEALHQIDKYVDDSTPFEIIDGSGQLTLKETIDSHTKPLDVHTARETSAEILPKATRIGEDDHRLPHKVLRENNTSE